MSIMNIEINKIIRSKRKTIAFKIDKDCNLIIKAPYSTSLDYIHKLVEKKKNWIIQKKLEVANREKIERDFSNGATIQLFGKIYTINYINNLNYAIHLKNNQIFVAEDLVHQIKSLFKLLIKRLAKLYFQQNVPIWAEKMQLSYKSIRIKNLTSRWGSCSTIGNLNFNWKLAFAPKEVIDYIIVHELAHLRYMDHSKKFWAEVEKYMPDFKTHRIWLRENGHLLDL